MRVLLIMLAVVGTQAVLRTFALKILNEFLTALALLMNLTVFTTPAVYAAFTIAFRKGIILKA